MKTPENELKEGQTIAEMIGVPKPDLSVLVPDIEVAAVALEAASAVVNLGEIAVAFVATIGEGLSNIDLG